jgi:hypothetical protein
MSSCRELSSFFKITFASVAMQMGEARWLVVITVVEVFLRTMQWLSLWHHPLLKVAVRMGSMYSERCISTEIAVLQRTIKEPQSYGILLQNRVMSLRRTGSLFCAQCFTHTFLFEPQL